MKLHWWQKKTFIYICTTLDDTKTHMWSILSSTSHGKRVISLSFISCPLSITVYQHWSLFVIVYHCLPLFVIVFMVDHGLSWFVMGYQGLSWFSMAYQSLSWPIMAYQCLSLFVCCLSVVCHFSIIVGLSTSPFRRVINLL